MEVDIEVLEDLIKRMEEGERVKPESDEEKLCFQLIKDLDHVGGFVKGSTEGIPSTGMKSAGLSAEPSADTAIVAIFIYQYLVVTKLVHKCIVAVANQPKKPVKQGARRDAGVG